MPGPPAPAPQAHAPLRNLLVALLRQSGTSTHDSRLSHHCCHCCCSSGNPGPFNKGIKFILGFGSQFLDAKLFTFRSWASSISGHLPGTDCSSVDPLPSQNLIFPLYPRPYTQLQFCPLTPNYSHTLTGLCSQDIPSPRHLLLSNITARPFHST